MFNPSAFAPPPVGADVFDNRQVATRNILRGPGGWGVNLGVHKEFALGERVRASIGADFNNIFNHPIRMPNSDFAGGFGTFANLGDFIVGVNPSTLTLNPIDNGDVNNCVFDPGQSCVDFRNDLFGVANQTFPQEGIDSRRTTRLRLRITF